MIRIRQTRKARADIDQIYAHDVETYGEVAADLYVGRLLDLFDLLLTHPGSAFDSSRNGPGEG